MSRPIYVRRKVAKDAPHILPCNIVRSRMENYFVPFMLKKLTQYISLFGVTFRDYFAAAALGKGQAEEAHYRASTKETGMHGLLSSERDLL